MAIDYVIGVDCSTTAAKAVVWNDRGDALSETRHAFDLSQPRPGWGEQNAEDWWTSLVAAVRRAVQTVDTSRIGALCLTHQRESFVCLDDAGKPLRPAMLWLDTRATDEVQEFGTDEVHRITGKPANPTPAWYKLLWLARHEPDTLARIGKVVDVHGFLVHRLTGEWVTSWASADPLGLVDMTTFDYDDGLLAAVGLSRDQLPDPRGARQRRGHLARRTWRATSGCPPACRWWQARGTVSAHSSAPGSPRRAGPTSTWAPASSRAPTATTTPTVCSSARCPGPCLAPTPWRPSSAAAPST